MDRNTLVAVLGSVALSGLVVYGSICVYSGIDGTITAVVSGALGATAGAVATYLKGKGGS